MKREEALEILDTIPTIGEQVDALEMAIEALKVKDVIEAFDRTIEAIKGREWFTCSKRLPNDSRQVLVTVLWHKPYGNLEVTLGEYWGEPEGWGDWKDGEVIAWMPLPEPYKEKK